VKVITQRDRDKDRNGYVLVFPSNMSLDQVLDWLRGIGSNMDNKLGALISRPTLVFELQGKNFGLQHRVYVPRGSTAEYLVTLLRKAGVHVTPIEDAPDVLYNYGTEVTMNDGARSLRIANVKDYANRLLAAAGPLGDGERVTFQWVISHTGRTKMPPNDRPVGTSRNSVWQALIGDTIARTDEISDRRTKAQEQSFHALGRIGAVADTPERAREIVGRIERALKSENDNKAFFRTRPVNLERFNQQIRDGHTPAQFHAQLSVTELAAVLGWPIDQPYVAGLPMGLTRHLPASASIPLDGFPVGLSNFPGNERRLSITAKDACRHIYLPGMTGAGKTTWMLNFFSSVVNAGHGAIIFDAKKDIAQGALSYVPRERLDDVIYFDLMDPDSAIGFNPLDQGRSSSTIDEVIETFGHMYPGVMRDVYARQLLHHGLHALEEARLTTGKAYTLLDLPVLLSPQFPEEKAWSSEIKRGLKDRGLKHFFAEWDALTPEKRKARFEPLANKYWQIDRPELRNVLGQTQSAFQMRDIVLGNKILIINGVGMNPNSLELAMVMFLNALWGAVKQYTPEKENFLFLDEFADFMKLPVSFEAMLAKARSAKLSMVMANQEFGQLTREMQSALMANAATKVVFQLSADDSQKIASEFGATVKRDDLTGLEKYHALARINTPSGVSPPASMTTFDEFGKANLDRLVIAQTRAKYGRKPADVLTEMLERRMPSQKQTRRPLGETDMDEE
jgi:hypothetical protein